MIQFDDYFSDGWFNHQVEFHHNQIVKGLLVWQSQLLVKQLPFTASAAWSPAAPWQPLRFLFSALISCSVLPILVHREGGLFFHENIFSVGKRRVVVKSAMGGGGGETWDFHRFPRTCQFPYCFVRIHWKPGIDAPDERGRPVVVGDECKRLVENAWQSYNWPLTQIETLTFTWWQIWKNVLKWQNLG